MKCIHSIIGFVVKVALLAVAVIAILEICDQYGGSNSSRYAVNHEFED